ncbi:MAG: cache domain-containing protein, partial [Bacillota bacterium]
MRILAAVLLLGIIPLGAAGGSLWVGWRALARTTYRQVAQMPLGAATRIEELLYFRYVDSIQFASNAAAISDTLDREVQSSLFRRLKELYQPYAWLGLVDGSGVVMAASDPATLGRRIPRPYFADSARRRADGVLLTDVHPSVAYPEVPVVGFSVPVAQGASASQGAGGTRGSGSADGYIYTEVSVAFLARHIMDVDPGQGGQVLLVDRDGRVIADRLGEVAPGTGRMVRYGDAVLTQGWGSPVTENAPPATMVETLAGFHAA